MARVAMTLEINPAIVAAARGKKGCPVRQALRQALSEAIMWWHSNRLPMHFTAGAEHRYGYTPRTQSYYWMKRGYYWDKKHGEKRYRGYYTAEGQRMPPTHKPLYFTGTMERTLTGTAPAIKMPRSENSPNVSVEGKLAYNRAANLWTGRRVVRSTGEAHNFDREITAVTEKEMATLTHLVEKRTFALLKENLTRGQYEMIRRRITA